MTALGSSMMKANCTVSWAELGDVTHGDTRGTQRHTLTPWKHTVTQIASGADLLDVFFGPDVRWVYQGAHDLQVAVDNKGLVRPVGVDADSPVVVH